MMLKDKSNPELKKRVLTKHISAKYVITCKVEDLASDKTKNELKILRMRSMESKQSDWFIKKNKGEKGMHTCEKCNSEETSFYE